MIYPESIGIIHSNIVIESIFSVEDLDYRTLDAEIRITEEDQRRETENNDIRIIE